MKNRIVKFVSVITAFVLLLNLFCINAFAASSVKIRQIDANLPEVRFEIQGKYDEDSIESAKLGGEKLSIKKVYKASEAEGRLVYMLIDISTSMNQRALDALKPSLISYADSLTKDDKLIVMTFGKSVKTVLKGGESKKKVRSTINSIKCNSAGTAFYDAMLKALNNSKDKKDFDRKYAIVVSDGADFEKGNSSQQEVVDELETNRLPFYGLCLSSTSKSNADGFGYITRVSGGELVKFSSGNAKSSFDSVKKKINDVTIVEAKSHSKKSLGTCELKVTLSKDGKNYVAEDKAFAKAAKDNEPPEVKEISFDKDKNCFVIKFSEDVENADKLSSYMVKKGSRELTAVSVKYNEEKHIAELSMNNRVYSGEYTFEFKNITDTSDNENALERTVETKDIEAYSIIIKILIIAGIALIPVAFLVALYLVLLNLKKKKNVTHIRDVFVAQEDVVEEEHVRIEQPQGRKILIHIQAGDGTVRNINYNLVKSAIFGRSEICDITIQDPVLSRQHFVIEDVEEGLAVCDLETTNGTYINGVRIQSKSFLDNHSTISVGNSIIKIRY